MDWLVCDQGFFLFGLSTVSRQTVSQKIGVANSKKQKRLTSIGHEDFDAA
jgi:hypothetical protein